MWDTHLLCPSWPARVDLVVHAETDSFSAWRVRGIVAVPDRVEGSVVETADLFTTRDDKLERADSFPTHPSASSGRASTCSTRSKDLR